MRTYILALIAALVLVAGAYEVNKNGTSSPISEPRVLPKSGFPLR